MSRVMPMIVLGAGASKAFGVPTMPEFLEDVWREMDGRSTAAAIAVRRSLEVTPDVVDLEEVMYLLDALAGMGREDALAAVFLPRFTAKDSQLQRLFDFEQIRVGASREREEMRRLIYTKCTAYDRSRAWEVYSRVFRSLYSFSGAPRIYVATTNYDRIIEHLWEERADGLHTQSPAFDLQTGFDRPAYGNPVLDPRRGYGEPRVGTDAAVHLIKLHGSLGWRKYEEGRVEETRAREYPGDFAVLAYPIRQDKSKEPPFSKLYEAFDDALVSADFIVIIGLSLRDEAIVGRLADSLRGGGKRAVIIDPFPEKVRNRLPQEVRRYVRTLKACFGTDVLLNTPEEWERAFILASGKEEGSEFNRQTSST